MTGPFFSIITVVFNAEAVLEKTARSLQEQDFRDFEWIIVDGGSTDRTLDIANRFFDAERDLLISEPDDGVYDAMNKGLRLARGKVVHFLNANDWYASEQVLSKISTTFQDDIDAVYGDTLLSLSDGRLTLRPAIEPGASLHRRMPFSHQAFFVRRKVHLQFPFDTRFSVSADKAVISQLYICGVKMVHAKMTTNVNTIAPEAISIAGSVQSAADDYHISVNILRRPYVEAAFYYLRKRVVILGVRMLERLPKPVFDKLPEGVRRRVY